MCSISNVRYHHKTNVKYALDERKRVPYRIRRKFKSISELGKVGMLNLSGAIQT